MKTQDINKLDESLLDVKDIRKSNASFLNGANWQKEKDKITIDKLVELLKECVNELDVLTGLEPADNYNQDLARTIHKSKRLLQQIEKEKQ